MPKRIGPPRVLVIGSGAAGLAAACRLASRGVQVLLMERRREFGGRTTLLHHQAKQGSGSEARNWHWDWESAALSQREHLELFWAKLGREFSADIRLQRLPPPRCFWLDGSEAVLDESFWQQPALSTLQQQAQAFSSRLRSLKNAPKPASSLRALHHELQTKFGKTLATEIQKLSDEKLRQVLFALASPQTSNPWLTPASVLWEQLSEYRQAQWRMEGGNAQLTAQLLKLAQDLQVECRPLCEVRHIFRGEQSHWRVQYSKLDRDSSHQLDCDGLVCAMDVTQSIPQLFSSPQTAPASPAPTPRSPHLSLSRFTLCLGLDQALPNLSAQNYFLGKAGAEEQRAQSLFLEGKLPLHPRLEVLLDSRLEPNWAPQGGESLQLRTSAPLIGPQIAWSSRARSYAESLLRHLEEDYGVVELQQSPSHFALRTPSDYESEFQLPLGSIQGSARHGSRAWARPSNRRRQFKQVAFAGASTHPGSSLAQCVQSGSLAAESLLQEFQLPL